MAHLNATLPKTRYSKVYFGGISEELDREISDIKNNLYQLNEYALLRSRPIVIPSFTEDLSGGTGPEGVEQIIASEMEGIHMYVEIIGDGFGDFSEKLATYALRATEDVPQLILLKENRTAKNMVYSEKFIRNNNAVPLKIYSLDESSSMHISKVFSQEYKEQFF